MDYKQRLGLILTLKLTPQKIGVKGDKLQILRYMFQVQEKGLQYLCIS
jgi:hypothetical protein